MTDVRLKGYQSLEGVTMDWLLLDTGRLDERDELATAVRVALGTDMLSDIDDVLPDPDSTDRRGWWGDLDADLIWGGWPIGCKNWLLTRAKITPAPAYEGATLDRARLYTLNALQPFVEKGVASGTEVTATRTELERIEVTALLVRGPLEEIELRYQLLWQEEFTSSDDETAAEIPDASINIRVPYRNLTLSPTPPLFRKMPPQANLVLSRFAPTRFVSDKKVANPAQANLALSATAPSIRYGNDAFTTSLLHFEGVNLGTVFTDSNLGGSSRTWSVGGAGVTTVTSAFKFGSSSLSASGAATSYIDTPAHVDFNFGTGDFTIECWFNSQGGVNTRRGIFGQTDASTANFAISGELHTTNVVTFTFFTTAPGSYIVTGVTGIATPGWHHAAFVRNGTVIKLFVDGVQEGGNVTVGNESAYANAFKFAIGRRGEQNTLSTWNGFIDEFRVSKGIARYTANFTPPSIPFV